MRNSRPSSDYCPHELGPVAHKTAGSGFERQLPARRAKAKEGFRKRVFDIDIEHCPHCGGTLKIIADIEDPAVITKILAHLGLPTRAPPHHLRQQSCFACCPASTSMCWCSCLLNPAFTHHGLSTSSQRPDYISTHPAIRFSSRIANPPFPLTAPLLIIVHNHSHSARLKREKIQFQTHNPP